MNYMNYQGNIPLQIHIYTRIDPLLDYLKNSEVDILFIAEEYVELCNQIEELISHIFILWEGKESQESYSRHCIFKYQAAKSIIKEFYDIYLEQDNHKTEYANIISAHNNNYIVGVFSLQSSNNQMLYSLMLSKYYSKNQKVLYISFDLFHQFSWLEGEEKGGLSEVLYYVKQRKANLTHKIDSVVSKYGNFHVISPVHHYQDLYEVTEDDIEFFLECLRDSCEYTVVIIDIGIFGNSIHKILKECNKIYILKEKNQIGRDKLAAFYKQIGDGAIEAFWQRFQEVEISHIFENDWESIERDVLNNDVYYDYVAAVVESGEKIEWKTLQN